MGLLYTLYSAIELSISLSSFIVADNAKSGHNNGLEYGEDLEGEAERDISDHTYDIVNLDYAPTIKPRKQPVVAPKIILSISSLLRWIIRGNSLKF